MEEVPVGNDAYLKRLACQIFTQLPENEADALRALRYARIIVENLHVEWKSCTSTDKITPLPSARIDRESQRGALREVSLDALDTANQGSRLS